MKQKQAYQNNKEQILKRNKIWRNIHEQEQKEYGKTYREINFQKIKDWNSKKVSCNCGVAFLQINKQGMREATNTKNT